MGTGRRFQAETALAGQHPGLFFHFPTSVSPSFGEMICFPGPKGCVSGAPGAEGRGGVGGGVVKEEGGPPQHLTRKRSSGPDVQMMAMKWNVGRSAEPLKSVLRPPSTLRSALEAVRPGDGDRA